MLCCANDVFGASHKVAAIAQINQRQNVLFSIVSNSFACDRQKAARGDHLCAGDASEKVNAVFKQC
jgi:hypothetical protein